MASSDPRRHLRHYTREPASLTLPGTLRLVARSLQRRHRRRHNHLYSPMAGASIGSHWAGSTNFISQLLVVVIMDVLVARVKRVWGGNGGSLLGRRRTHGVAGPRARLGRRSLRDTA